MNVIHIVFIYSMIRHILDFHYVILHLINFQLHPLTFNYVLNDDHNSDPLIDNYPNFNVSFDFNMQRIGSLHLSWSIIERCDKLWSLNLNKT